LENVEKSKAEKIKLSERSQLRIDTNSNRGFVTSSKESCSRNTNFVELQIHPGRPDYKSFEERVVLAVGWVSREHTLKGSPRYFSYLMLLRFGEPVDVED
jgi:hypothetical protein